MCGVGRGPPRDHTGGDRRPVASTPGDRNFCPAGGICGYSSLVTHAFDVICIDRAGFCSKYFSQSVSFCYLFASRAPFFFTDLESTLPRLQAKTCGTSLGIQGDRPCCGSLNWLDKRGKLVFDRLPSFNKNKIVV